jgi:hypothetical protein
VRKCAGAGLARTVSAKRCVQYPPRPSPGIDR